MNIRRKLRDPKDAAPPILLRQAAFLVRLGKPRAALVLYDWALALAPADPAATHGQAEARRLAVEADTRSYWKRVTGRDLDLDHCAVQA